jgi:predicted amidophosphoribosyltransferase
MYCYRCGNRLPDDSAFCNRCGVRLRTTTERVRGSRPIESDPTPTSHRDRLQVARLNAFVLTTTLMMMKTRRQIIRPVPISL